MYGERVWQKCRFLWVDIMREYNTEPCHTKLKSISHLFVYLPFPMPFWLTWLWQKWDFVFFMQRGIRTHIPIQSWHVNMVYLVSPGWPVRFWVCMCVCVFESSHASHHKSVLFGCGSPFVFLSGCSIAALLCSSCCNILCFTRIVSNFNSYFLCFWCRLDDPPPPSHAHAHTHHHHPQDAYY